MPPSSAVPVQPVLRVCLHLLVVGLLALTAVRAVAGLAPHAGAILATAVAVGLVYAIGPVLPPVRRSASAAAAWLTVLGSSWLVLLYWTPDGIWLAFPLFFLQLHLLPRRGGCSPSSPPPSQRSPGSRGTRTPWPRRWSSARSWVRPSRWPPCSVTRRCTGRARRAGG